MEHTYTSPQWVSTVLTDKDLESLEIWLIHEHIQRQNWGTRETCNILKIIPTFKVELLTASVTDYLFKYFDSKDDKQKDGIMGRGILTFCEAVSRAHEVVFALTELYSLAGTTEPELKSRGHSF